MYLHECYLRLKIIVLIAVNCVISTNGLCDTGGPSALTTFGTITSNGGLSFCYTSYTSTIAEQKKCHGTVVGSKVLPVSNFTEHLRTTCTNMQQGVQADAMCSTQHCCDLLADNITQRLTSRIYGTEL